MGYTIYPIYGNIKNKIFWKPCRIFHDVIWGFWGDLVLDSILGMYQWLRQNFWLKVKCLDLEIKYIFSSLNCPCILYFTCRKSTFIINFYIDVLCSPHCETVYRFVPFRFSVQLYNSNHLFTYQMYEFARFDPGLISIFQYL